MMTIVIYLAQYFVTTIIIMTQNRTSQIAFSPSQPIYIQDEISDIKHQKNNIVASISLLPAFEAHQSITKLLYSKFIVKGVRPINEEAIKAKLINKSHQKPKRKTTQQTANCTRQVIVKQKSTIGRTSSHYRNVSQQAQFFQNPKEKILHRKGKSESNLYRLQPQSFQRSSVFGRPQTAIPKSISFRQNARPQSATTQRPRSASSKALTTKRPSTALTRKSSQQVLPQRYQYSAQKGNQLLTISESHPNLRQVDYVKKNKRELSSAKRSIYLTNFDRPESAVERQKQELNDKSDEKQLKIKREVVTYNQKKAIAEKQRKYLKFMKENMPYQYQQCIQYLNKEHPELDQDSRSLLSLSIADEQPIDLTTDQVQQFQVQNFYETFLNKCLNVEYGIKKLQPQKKVTQYISHILNFQQCEQILSLYRSLQQFKQSNMDYKHCNEQIKNIVSNLSFFKELRPQVMKNVFQMEYQIIEVQQEQIIIRKDQSVSQVYIILNGSVSKQQVKEQDQDYQDTFYLAPPQFLVTLFDGQIFGLPSKVHQKVYTYSVKTLQKCLLMVLPFKQYRGALSSNQNINDRIQLLKQAFPNLKGTSKLTNQDYQTIAYQMDTITHQAQQIVIRQGQNSANLMLVASGSLQICFQSIVRRKKTNVDPLIKKRKDLRKQVVISELRKNNLINYELVQENQREMHYYRVEPYQEKVRGDVLNWKGFHQSFPDHSNYSEPLSIPYSIMSTRNQTKIYLLSFAKISKLSQHIVKKITQAAREKAALEKIKRDQTDLNKWEEYKVKICSDILQKKNQPF